MNSHGHSEQITDEERREFLKFLGVAGTVTAGGAGLQEVRNAMAASSTAELAPVGQSIQADLAGTMDAQFIAEQQAALGATASGLPAVVEHGFPIAEPRHEFAAIEEAGRPIYEHLVGAEFFKSTTKHLPAFDQPYLESAIETFVGSEAISNPLAELGLTGGAGIDLLTEVVANAETLRNHHWAATDAIPRAELEINEFMPSMTQGATGGVLLWLKDLDHHLWANQVLLTEGILSDAEWYGQSMAAGFSLMSEGAKAIAAENGAYSEGELAALLSVGFAVQAISQTLLPQNVYWITEEMRAPRA